MPTSGPPYEATVRSRSDERAIARTSAIGLRREPQPPMPIVMPSRSSPTTSSMVARLSAIVFLPVLALVDERVPRLVTRAGEVELEGEALLEAVGPSHVNRVDAVERLLRRTHDDRVGRGDLRGDLSRCGAELVPWHDLEHAAVRRQLLSGRTFGGVDHVAHPVLRHEPRQVRRCTERTLLDLGQAEGRVVGRDDDVGVAGETDAPPEAEPVHRGDDGNRAVVDRGESGVATSVGTHKRREALGLLHLLDVDARVEAL